MLARFNQRHAIILIALTLIWHIALRLFASSTLELDDAEQVFHVMNGLSLGYQLDQPPLYTWLVWGTFQVFGPSIFSLTLVKYVLLIATFWQGFRISALLFKREDLRLYGSMALLLIWIFAYQSHVGFSHTIMLGLAILSTLDALIRFKQRVSWGAATYLGLAVGVGLLSKYSYLLFLAPLSMAALCVRDYRHALLTQHALSALALALMLATPHLTWVYVEFGRVSSLVATKLSLRDVTANKGTLHSLYKLTKSGGFFALPMALVLCAALPSLFKKRRQRDAEEMLLTRFYQILLVAVLSLACFYYMPTVRPRWFHPFLLVLPFFLLLRARDVPAHRYSKLLVVGSTILCSVVAAGYHFETYVLAPYFGHGGRPNRPIMATLAELPDGWDKRSQICVPDRFLLPHLYLYQPTLLPLRSFAEIDKQRDWVVLWNHQAVAPQGLTEPIIRTLVMKNGVTYPIYLAFSDS